MQPGTVEAPGTTEDDAKRFGVKLDYEQLQVTATPENFPLKKHGLIQAMLAINDLFYLAEPVVKNLFFEEVIAWMDLNGVHYTPKVKFTGLSGYDLLFDFVVPKSRRAPDGESGGT
ncbi:MAG TPA: DUF1828 domain-containing protein [Bryobacteraceae bacterium]|nr:DUF1828 domain-containing protein [Bryobacteraceae bacterium]